MEEEKEEIKAFEDDEADIQPTAPLEEEIKSEQGKKKDEVVEEQRRILQAIKAEHQAKKDAAAAIKKDAPGVTPVATPTSKLTPPTLEEIEQEFPQVTTAVKESEIKIEAVDDEQVTTDLPHSSSTTAASQIDHDNTRNGKIFGLPRRVVLILGIFLTLLIVIVIVMQVIIFVMIADDDDNADSGNLDDEVDDPGSSIPTLYPTSSPAPSATSTIIPRKSCISTVNDGRCIQTNDELLEVVSRTQTGDIIALCPNIIFRTDRFVHIVDHNITLCCGTDYIEESAISTACTIEGINSNRILQVSGESFTLQGITFQNGGNHDNPSDWNSAFDSGNVYINAGGHHRILDCTFFNGTGCPASNLHVGDSESLIVEHSKFTGGQGRCPSLHVTNVPYLAMYHSKVQNNTSVGLLTGNLNDYTDGQTIIMDETSFINNTETYGWGGGFLASGLGTMPSLTIRNSLFKNNRAAYGAAGAAIFYTDEFDLVLTNNTGNGNFAYDKTDEEACDGFLVAFYDSDRCFAVSEEYISPLPSTSTPSMLLLSNWTVDYASEYYTKSTRELSGEMRFRNGRMEANLHWHLGSFDTWVEDRADSADYTRSVVILERSVEARVFHYKGYSTALWKDERGSDQTFEFRRDLSASSRPPGSRDDEFITLLQSLRYVKSSEYFAAMPDSVITQETSSLIIQEMLQGVPIPGSIWDADFQMITRFASWYHLGADVTSVIVCQLINDWSIAVENMDYEAERYYMDKMQSTRDWDVLKQMDSMGGWSQVVWEYATDMRENPSVLIDNKVHISGLGCLSDESVITY